MTYRYVPQIWRLIAQLATLLATAAIGLSLVLTPPNADPKLSEFEQTMGADPWGYALIAFGLIGFIAESVSVWRKTVSLFWLVSICHIMCMSLMLAYGAAALVGLISRHQWYNFAAPVLAALLALWHYIYIKRRAAIPLDVQR